MLGKTRAKLALITAALAALAVVPASANAALLESGACDDAALSRPFAKWGDYSQYKLAPNGDFENGAGGWALSGGARLGSGSEPYAVTGERGDASLTIPAGGSAISPATCVNLAYPTFRFFARSSGGLLGLLPAMKVDVLYRDGALKLVSVPAGVVTPSPVWGPTLPMLTLSAVGATLNGGEAPIAIRFTSLFGTWSVDDVFVDPYRRA